MSANGRLATALRGLLPDLGEALRRFPLAVLFAALFTALHLAGMSDVLGLSGDQSLYLSLALISAFLWSFACALAAETRTAAKPIALALTIAGLVLIAIAFLLRELLDFQPFLALPALLIGVGLAPYGMNWRAPANAIFWQFNQRLWFGAGLALLGAVLFAGGLSIIIETIEALFDVSFPSASHEKIWTLGLGLVAPLNWLTLAPADFTDRAEEGDPREFTARATATIVKYILAPLVLVYTAILYAYAVKIAADGVLPKGRVGPLVLGYGAVGTISLLLAFPIRSHGGPLVAALWRHWHWLTLVPAGLLGLALYQRIGQYGWTEERYLVALAGIWLVLMALAHAGSRGRRELRMPPLLLAGLLIAASIGPWGALGLSLRSQTGELAHLLAAEGRLEGGKLSDQEGRDPLPRESAQRARSIVRYLARRERLERLAPWFEPSRSPFEGDDGPRDVERRLLTALGVPKPFATKVPGPLGGGVALEARLPEMFALAGFERIAGPIVFALPPGSSDQSFDVTDEGGDLRVEVTASGIAVALEGSPRVKFEAFRILEEAGAAKPNRPRLLRRSTDELTVGLLFDRLSGRPGEGGAAGFSGRFWVLIGPGAP